MNTSMRSTRANWTNRDIWRDNPPVQRIGDDLSSRHIEPDSFCGIIANLLTVWHALLRNTHQKELSRVGRLHIVHCVIQGLWREVTD